MRSIAVVAFTAAFCAGCYEASPPKEASPGVTAESLQGKLRHRNMLLSSQSNFRDPQLRVIQYPEDYDEMWRSGFTNVGGLTKPYVNFDTDMVILVTGGVKPRSGYQIRVDSVVSKSELLIYVSSSTPSSSCVGLNRITAPAHIVTVPWMEKPARFVEDLAIGTGCT